ncbi:MAG: histidine kinase [Pseudomonadota bacterium]
MKFESGYLKNLFAGTSTISLSALAGMYGLAFLFVELFIDNPIRHYNFCVFLSLSGIFFSWLIGGRRAMYYVAFFNIFFLFIFSSLLWNKGIIVHSGLFVTKSFFTIYIVAIGLLALMVLKKSPADQRMEKQKKAVEEARQQRQNLEFMVASRKLKQDLLAQANLVKDELQLLEGAWRSKIHDIINDLPIIKERELYQQIMVPFQENIIGHLRDLALSLTFDLEPVELSELLAFLCDKINHSMNTGTAASYIDVHDAGWQNSSAKVTVDKNKTGDMIVNILRNSQAALDLKRIEMLRSGQPVNFKPGIRIVFGLRDSGAEIHISDNAGGVPDELISQLFNEPVASSKRGGNAPGQGTLFVKFFAERMGLRVRAENTSGPGEKGLAVSIALPIESSPVRVAAAEGIYG